MNHTTLIRFQRTFQYWLMVSLFQVLATGCVLGQGVPKVNSIDDVAERPPAWQDLNYPKSSSLAGVVFDESTHQTAAPGSDIWPITWADDDHQYSAFGDGGGFGGSNNSGRVSKGVTRIEGSHMDYVGKNVWGGYDAENPAEFTGKGTGILCVDGVLYMWVAGNASKTVSNVQLAVSRDHSKSWSLMDWSWTM